MARVVATISSGIVQAKVDDWAYRCIKLSNGIDALLISDPSADKAAASMDVRLLNLMRVSSRVNKCASVCMFQHVAARFCVYIVSHLAPKGTHSAHGSALCDSHISPLLGLSSCMR
jgi:hypothetical protein